MSGMIIQINMLAMNAHRNIINVGKKHSTASERLSSGFRINRAADDAAGLAISEKMQAQIRGMKQAQKSTEDGINACKTMDGGMSEISNIMIRQRELIIQALNDTNTTEDRDKIQLEIDQLTKEIGMIAERTTFNNIPLLNVPKGGVLIPATPGTPGTPEKPGKPGKPGDPIPIDLTSTSDVFFVIDVSGSMVRELNFIQNTVKSFMRSIAGDIRVGFIIYSDHLTVPGEDMIFFELNSNPDAVTAFINGITLLGGGDTPEAGLEATHEAIDRLSSSAIGRQRHIIKITDAISHTSDTLPAASHTVAATNARLISEGVQFHSILPPSASAGAREQCRELANGTGGDVHADFNFGTPGTPGTPGTLGTPGTPGRYSTNGLWIQNGANSRQGLYVDRYDCRPESLYEDIFSPHTITIYVDGKPKQIAIVKLVTQSREEATASLIALDSVFGKVNGYRAKVGAQQNRLEHSSVFLGVAFSNLEGSQSRIKDADMAKEMMNLTKSIILQQAGITILAQANQAPQFVLQLLR